jgi:hypothetical protein
MASQLGFGWGRGRLVIKTVVTGEAAARPLERQQQWLDRPVVADECAPFDTRAVLDVIDQVRGRRRTPKLRMAKADLDWGPR